MSNQHRNFAPAQPSEKKRISRGTENALAIAVLALLLCLFLIFAVAVGRVDAQSLDAADAAKISPRWIAIGIVIMASIIASVLVIASAMMTSIVEERARIVAAFRNLPTVRMPAELEERLKRWQARQNEEHRRD